jgi:hypothetical protein
LDGFITVPRLAAHFPAAFRLKDIPQRTSDAVIVIGHQNP